MMLQCTDRDCAQHGIGGVVVGVQEQNVASSSQSTGRSDATRTFLDILIDVGSLEVEDD